VLEPETDTAGPDSLEPDEAAIADRAEHLSWLPNAGNEAENWERARAELRVERALTAQRAEEIARTRGAADALGNWLLAEQELQVELGMRRADRTKIAYYEGSVRARDTERQRIANRARKISHSAGAGSDGDNWLRAERRVRAEHRLIAERARHHWAGSGRWLQAEQELLAEGIIPIPDAT
jgi:hypothetical protein